MQTAAVEASPEEITANKAAEITKGLSIIGKWIIYDGPPSLNRDSFHAATALPKLRQDKEREQASNSEQWEKLRPIYRFPSFGL